MPLTNEDRLVDTLMPAIRASRPASQLLQQKAVARAITPDGFLNPPALLPGSSIMVDFDAASNTVSSSDTVNPVEYISTTVSLPEGVWRFKAEGAVTGSLDSATNLNAAVYLNGEASTNYQIPIAAADRLATVFAVYTLTEVSGDVFLQVMFRPSAGTATIEAGRWGYRAERIR